MLYLILASAQAKSWCAAPLIAHEWGVTVLTADSSAPRVPDLPGHFHRAHTPFAVASSPVRSLPADSGVRTLPVMHFYSPSHAERIPIGVEVGFTQGEASVWYPAVDELTPALPANGPEAAGVRAALVQAREQANTQGADHGRDPTRQLHWDRLELSTAPESRPVHAEDAWVDSARAISDARWVGRPGEAERFLFYEADTRESSAVEVSFDAKVVTVRNTSRWPVHDVVVMHEGLAAQTPTLLPGATAKIPLSKVSTLESMLFERWTAPKPDPSPFVSHGDDCVMMENPAVPVEQATDHRLYGDEIETLWFAWGDRLLDPEGTRLLYRESPAALDAAMPISLYTDQRHWISLSRFGLVLVENLEAL